VNTRGPINDFSTNLSTFFTSCFHLKCKSTSFLSELYFEDWRFFDQQTYSGQLLGQAPDKPGIPCDQVDGNSGDILRCLAAV
jgi:hypothetical protein